MVTQICANRCVLGPIFDKNVTVLVWHIHSPGLLVFMHVMKVLFDLFMPKLIGTVLHCTSDQLCRWTAGSRMLVGCIHRWTCFCSDSLQCHHVFVWNEIHVELWSSQKTFELVFVIPWRCLLNHPVCIFGVKSVCEWSWKEVLVPN